MKVLIFGAGASHGTTNGRLPVAADFGRQLHAQFPDWKKKYQTLPDLIERSSARTDNGWCLEPVWTRIDYFGKFRSYFRDESDGGAWSFDIHRAVTAVYGTSAPEMDALVPPDAKCTLIQLLEDLKPGDLVVSFNWDPLVEYIADRLARRGRCPALRQVPCPTSHGSVTLAKPHGSVTWLHRFGMPILVHADDYAPLLDAYGEDSVILRRQEPFFVSCVPIKSELLKEIQNQCDTPDAWDIVRTQWEALIDGVQRAEHLVVAGYCIPPEDEYSKFLLHEAAARRSGDPLVVTVYNLKQEEETICQALRDVLLTDRIEFVGPVDGARKDAAAATA